MGLIAAVREKLCVCILRNGVDGSDGGPVMEGSRLEPTISTAHVCNQKCIEGGMGKGLY